MVAKTKVGKTPNLINEALSIGIWGRDRSYHILAELPIDAFVSGTVLGRTADGLVQLHIMWHSAKGFSDVRKFSVVLPPELQDLLD